MGVYDTRATAVTLDGDDLSPFGTEIKMNRSADSYDVTPFGVTAKRYKAGLLDGTATLTGHCDNAATTGASTILRPLVGGAAVELIYKPEGTATGKSTQTVDVLVLAYEETAPVAGICTFSATLQFVEAVVDSTQS